MRIAVVSLLLAFSAGASYAQDRLIRLETRPGVTVPFYYMKRQGAPATLVLLPGGRGAIGMKSGWRKRPWT